MWSNQEQLVLSLSLSHQLVEILRPYCIAFSKFLLLFLDERFKLGIFTAKLARSSIGRPGAATTVV